MEKLVQNLLGAYKQSIQSLYWMTEETKQKALAKLATFDPKIGYPKKWKDYSALVVKPDDLEIGRAHVELQSLMRISYAVFCLKKKIQLDLQWSDQHPYIHRQRYIYVIAEKSPGNVSCSLGYTVT